MNGIPKRTNVAIHIICGTLFAVFAFCYLYFYQADLLAVAQWILSGGRTQYNHLMGAIFIALILSFLQILVSRVYKWPLQLYALSFFPSALLLTVLTCIKVTSDNSLTYSTNLLFCLFAAIVFAALAWITAKMRGHEDTACHRVQPLYRVWVNILLMVALFTFVCLCGNSDRNMHVRMRMEQCIINNDYDGALASMYNIRKTDENLTMLTAYALSRKNLLPERLFDFQVSCKSSSLLPTDRDGRTLMVSDSEIYKYLGAKPSGHMPAIRYLQMMVRSNMAKSPVVDYLLCAYLLDGNLDAFVMDLEKYYIIDSSLPRHYQEALILYNRLHSTPKIIYKNSVMDADFQDYQRLEHRIANKAERRNKIRDVYGNTYWYYYQYVISGAVTH